MAAMCYPRAVPKPNGSNPLGGVVLTGLVIAMAAVAVIYCQHAVARHGADAEAVRKCLNDNGPYQTWATKSGTFYKMCQLEDGRWGIQALVKDISGKLAEKTSFIKESAKTWSDVAQYLRTCGATKINFIP